LYLIKKEEINIYDIPITRITEQYLEYLKYATRIDLENITDPEEPGMWRLDALRGMLHAEGRNEPIEGPKLDWVIFGGESGPNARECRVEWVRDIVRQCQKAGVPVFVKQLGARVVEREPSVWPKGTTLMGDGFGNYLASNLQHKKGGNIEEWPSDLRVREFPRTAP